MRCAELAAPPASSATTAAALEIATTLRPTGRPYILQEMQQLLAFAAALVALRLSGRLARHWRARRAPELAAWAAALLAYAIACAALAWGAAAGWDGRVFRVYYLFGGLLSAPLLGLGSLLLLRAPFARAIGWLYAG